MPRRAGRKPSGLVAGALRDLGRQDQVAVRVLDVDHALGADDADLDARRPSRARSRAAPSRCSSTRWRRRPSRRCRRSSPWCRCSTAPCRSTGHRPTRGVFPSISHSDMSRLCVPDTTIGVRWRRSLRAPRRGDRHHPVHEGAGDDRMHVADLAGDQPLLHRQEAAAEALGVADDRVDARRLDRRQDLLATRAASVASGFSMKSAWPRSTASERRRAHGCSRRSRRSSRVTSGRAISSSKSVVKKSARMSALQLLAELRVDVAEPDPADARIVAREHRADAADRAAPDDRQPDLLADRPCPPPSPNLSAPRSPSRDSPGRNAHGNHHSH